MPRPDRTRSTSLACAAAAAIAAFASIAPSTASADDYDMDCKLILCMPAGFPSGCGDAYRHMIDRLRDGKSPIGVCAMSNGAEYDYYDIDYATKPPTTSEGWQCPEGKTLYHRSVANDGLRNATVNTFCYDDAYTRRGWNGQEGYHTTTTYTNKTPLERTDFWVNLTLEPNTPEQVSQGWQTFDTGRGSRVRVQYTE